MVKASTEGHTAATKAKIAKARATIPDSIVSEIRMSDESAAEIADRLNIKRSYVYKVRSQKCRSPMVASSVFEWRPA